jgi:hypothetical protein
MIQERKEAVANEIHGGLVAGDEQQNACNEQLALAQPVPLLLGRDQETEQVVTGRLATLRNEIAEVVEHSLLSYPTPLHDFFVRRHADGVDAPREVRRPLTDPAMGIGRDTEHLADHRHGQRVGEIRDHVHRVRVLDPMQQPIDDVLDVAPHALDHAWGKRLTDEPAQARMIWRVSEQH